MGEDQRHVPKAREMRRHAAVFVAQATAAGAPRRLPLPLDYSVASLRLVDFLVDGLRKGGQERARVAGALFGLGAYVGEVLVRRTGGAWVDLDESQRAYFGQPVGVRMPDGRVWSPLSRVVNRFDVGPEESLQTFYLTLHGRARKAS